MWPCVICTYWSMSSTSAVAWFYNHQSNGQVETCIKFLKDHKNAMKLMLTYICLLLQIISKPMSHGVMTLATLLFNSLSGDILPEFSRPPTVCDSDECNHTALINRKLHVNKDVDTCKIYFCSLQKYIFCSYRIDCSSKMRGWVTTNTWTIVGHGAEDNRWRNHKIWVTKTRCTITRMKRSMKAIPISVENCPRNEMSKTNRTQRSNNK